MRTCSSIVEQQKQKTVEDVRWKKNIELSLEEEEKSSNDEHNVEDSLSVEVEDNYEESVKDEIKEEYIDFKQSSDPLMMS